ncbi:cupin domain-containing protein [Paenibacillus humicus]|uniref:cupin domain-containing protein n=1 Tax=Paenibacillus humicus TaxID=412861 RepID=UPI003F5CEE57
MTDSILQSPNLTLCADSNEVLNFKRDSHNYITQLFGEQLPAIRTGLFNVHLTKGIIIQPHWHTNVTELVFVISGEVMTSVFDPFTQKLMNCKLKPGQVAVLPKGWFHWIVTLSEKAHILTIFDQPTPDIVYGSDFLRFTPKEIMNLAYCVDEEEYAKAVAPIQQSLILGPPPGCSKVQALQEAPGGHGYGVGHAQPLVQGMAGMYGHEYGGGQMMPEMQGMPGMYGHGYGGGQMMPEMQGMPGMYGHGYGGGPMMPEMQGIPGMYGHGYGGGPMMPEMQGIAGMYGHGYGGEPMMPEMQGIPGMYGHGYGGGPMMPEMQGIAGMYGHGYGGGPMMPEMQGMPGPYGHAYLHKSPAVHPEGHEDYMGAVPSEEADLYLYGGNGRFAPAAGRENG